MAVEHIQGDVVVESGLSTEISDKDKTTIYVDGPYALIKDLEPADYCPEGLEVDTYGVSTTGDGMARLTINCIRYESGDDWSPVRTTFKIDMTEVCYDLVDHPYLISYRDRIMMWLATEDSERTADNKYYYKDRNGTLQEFAAGSLGEKFCLAYMAGIKTFNRYYPVIERISTWRNPPGLTRAGNSFSGGNPMFSIGIGRYDEPPLALNGYPSANWFKSRDCWSENGGKSWTRTEQWTYTPEGSSSGHAWIYTEL